MRSFAIYITFLGKLGQEVRAHLEEVNQEKLVGRYGRENPKAEPSNPRVDKLLFRIGSMKAVLTRIDEHLRTRVRIVIWKQ